MLGYLYPGRLPLGCCFTFSVFLSQLTTSLFYLWLSLSLYREFCHSMHELYRRIYCYFYFLFYGGPNRVTTACCCQACALNESNKVTVMEGNCTVVDIGNDWLSAIVPVTHVVICRRR